MSLINNGVVIVCDGDGCTAAVRYPVTLSSDTSTSDTRGWLFIMGTDQHRHYCPHCTRKHLSDSSDEATP